ncbi:MAG: right-handed parallel beta-helix repeat-containing protein [Candidatus Bipolaricaulota bacterium]
MRRLPCLSPCAGLALRAALGLAVCLVPLCHAVAQDACLLTVSSTEALRDVLLSARPGATICLRAGTYTGPFEVTHDVTLQGTGHPVAVVLVLPAGATGSVVSLSYTGTRRLRVALENLTVAARSEAEASTDRKHAVFAGPDVGLTMHRVICVASDGAGVYLARNASLAAGDCEFRASRFGAYLDAGAVAQFHETRFSANAYGLVAGKDTQTLLRGCEFNDNTEVGVIVHAAQASLEGCSFAGNGWGVVLSADPSAPPQVRIEGCEILACRFVGVSLMTSTCFSDEAPNEASVQVSGGRNRIPSPQDDRGNAGGALCPAAPDEIWPADFLLDTP